MSSSDLPPPPFAPDVTGPLPSRTSEAVEAIAVDSDPGPVSKPLNDDDLPPMQGLHPMANDSDTLPAERVARDIVTQAARESLVTLLGALDSRNAPRVLLQIERLSKCFRAAEAHLGQPVYPEQMGRHKRGFGGMVNYQDRETMGVTAFQHMLGVATAQVQGQIPTQIDALLSAAETARRGKMDDLAATLEAKAKALTESLATAPAESAAKMAAATRSVGEAADAYEGAGGVGVIGNLGGPFGADADDLGVGSGDGSGFSSLDAELGLEPSEGSLQEIAYAPMGSYP